MANRTLRSGLTLACVLLSGPQPHGSLPWGTPVERLVANLGKYVQEHPDDPDGWYRLGRVHTLALETGLESVRAWAESRPAEGSHARLEIDDAAKSTPQQTAGHLAEALQSLDRAIALRPLEPRYRLTLACALEAGAPLLAKVDVWPLSTPADRQADPASPRRLRVDERRRQQVRDLAKDPSGLQDIVEEMRTSSHDPDARAALVSEAQALRNDPRYRDVLAKLREIDWRDLVEEQFFTATCQALPTNSKASQKPIRAGGELSDWTSYEAATGYLRVVGKRPPRPEDQIRVKVAKATLKAFDELPQPGAITPIVLSLSEPRPLQALLAPDARVTFDLDGTGRPQSWPWVGRDTGILVWDPGHTGRIVSGRQLFGSVTWWLFFANGYQALDALDDDRDGELRGRELTGLAVWIDRDGDGVSGPGEVVPVERLGIVALATRGYGPDPSAPRSLACPAGMRRADGTALPTYDWVAEGPRTSATKPGHAEGLDVAVR